MGPVDPSFLERTFLAIAHALFMNRLHLLRLTEVVRLHVEPDAEDGLLELPPDVDNELRQQAIDYVLTCFPRELQDAINQAKDDWMRPA